jgi:hypothetical protein
MSSTLLLLSVVFAIHARKHTKQSFGARRTACPPIVQDSIVNAWRVGSEQDAWIFHRALLDRLIHLRHLNDADEFERFEKHSFMSLFEMRHQLLSDPDMRHKTPPSLKALQKSNRARYDELKSKNRWHRPKAEPVAKSMGLGFLYRFAYDYASMHVHPMADDGEGDFARLTSSS